MWFPPWGGKGSIVIGTGMRSRSAHLDGRRVVFSPATSSKGATEAENAARCSSRAARQPARCPLIFTLLWRSKCSVQFLMPLNIKSHPNAAQKDFICIFWKISGINRRDGTGTDSDMSLLLPTSGKKINNCPKVNHIKQPHQGCHGYHSSLLRGSLPICSLLLNLFPLCGGITAEMESVLFKYYLCFQTVWLTDRDAPEKHRNSDSFSYLVNVIGKYSYSRINLPCSGFFSIRNDLAVFK